MSSALSVPDGAAAPAYRRRHPKVHGLPRCARAPGMRIVVVAQPMTPASARGHPAVHAFITGHLADARIADIEREVAHGGHRAQLRAARDMTTRARRDVLLGAVRRLVEPWLATPEPRTGAFPSHATTPPTG